MVFSSITFLYAFLPGVLLLYFLAPRNLKNSVLLLSSLAFYGWGEPRLLVLMVAAIVLFYVCGLAIHRARKQIWKRIWLSVSVAAGVAMLAVFKYADFFIASFNSVTGLGLPLLKLALPVGISFYTFQCMSYAVDVYRGDAPAQRNIVNFGAYVSMFPQLIAGPIVRYADIARELDCRQHTLEDARQGIARFLTGLGKKVILADNFALLCAIFRDSNEKSVLFYWLYALGFMLNIYFDFSGYSDMAIGLGRIMGFHFVENFDHPYVSKSVQEFWRRWHKSLGSWFRDYVYIPLGGSRVRRSRWVVNVLVVWMLTGLWHGAAWNFVLWGLLYAAMLLLEKFVPALQKLPTAVRRGYVLLTVLLGFVLFNAADLTQAGSDIAGLFGFGGVPAVSAESLYYLRSYGLLFAMGIVGATPLVSRLGRRIRESRMGAALETVWLLMLLLVCTGYLVDGSFSPFLYFRF